MYEIHLQTFIKFNQLKFIEIQKKIKSASVFFIKEIKSVIEIFLNFK